MELSLLLLEALDEWGVSPLLVLAITVHEVATTLVRVRVRGGVFPSCHSTELKLTRRVST